MALTQIDDRGLKTPIDLIDNEKIRFGTGNDLEIYHDGSNNYFLGTVNNWIKSTGTQGFTAGSDYQLTCVADGAVNLYYDGTKKLETTTNGWKSGDSVKGVFGTGDDLQIYHDGASKITNSTGALYIAGDDVRITNAAIGETGLKFVADGAVELYYNNVKQFETIDGGVRVPDSKDIQAGDSGDLKLYHDGSNSYIRNLTGALYLRTGTGLNIQNSGGTETYLYTEENGAVFLRYDNVTKFETTSTGVNITDSVYVDNSKLLVGTSTSTSPIGWNNSLQVAGTSAAAGVSIRRDENGTGGALLVFGKSRGSLNGNTVVQDGDSLGSMYFAGADGTDVNTVAAQIDIQVDGTPGSNDMPGRMVFKTTPDGSTSAAERLRITSTGTIRIPDNGKYTAGAGDDFEVYHEGSNTLVKNHTGWLAINSDHIAIKDGDDGDSFIACNHDASVQLYYDGTEKFRTETNGVRLLGDSVIWMDPWQGRLDRGWSDYPAITITPSTTYGSQGEFRMHGSPGTGLYGTGADFALVVRTDGSFEDGSDRRRKTNIEDITGALATVKQLTGKKFNIINRQGELDPNKGSKKQFGLIAQECKDIIPEAVTFHPDEDTPNENGWASAYGLSYGNLTPLLINAVKELSAEVETLKTKVAALEAA